MHNELLMRYNRLYKAYLDYLEATHNPKYKTEEELLRRATKRMEKRINATAVSIREKLERM